MLKIREYQEKDKKDVIELISKILFEIFKSKPNYLPDLKNIKRYYFGNKGIFYVAEDNGKVIGTIGVLREKKDVARLMRMYVSRTYRRHGVGQKLLDKIFQFCKNRSYKEIILSTYPEMEAAIKFYKKNGFKEYKREGFRIFFKKNIKTT